MLLDMLILLKEWSNLLLVAVGFSAFAVYQWQKRDQCRTAATLVLGEIDLVEKRISNLTNEGQLNNISIYYSQSVLTENLWDNYKHLLIKRLSASEVELVSHFFENAQRIETARSDILESIRNDWNHASLVEHYFAGMLTNVYLRKSKADKLNEDIETFKDVFGALELTLTSNLSIRLLNKYLDNFSVLSGTTAYEKIQKLSFAK